MRPITAYFFEGIALAVAFTVPAGAATLAKSFCNGTGGAVNDWHVFERGGNATLVTVVSNGLAPVYTPMPATTQAAPPAANQATLSGGNVPAGGCISVTMTVPDGGLIGNTGVLDWYWTNGGNQVGPVHTNAQAIFASLTSMTGPNTGNIVVTATNDSSSTADYSNFQFGTSAQSVAPPDYSEFPPPPPSGETVLIPPTSFTIGPGQTETFTLSNVQISSFFDVFTDLSVGGDSLFQFQEGAIPEPSGVFLCASAIACIGLRLLKKSEGS